MTDCSELGINEVVRLTQNRRKCRKCVNHVADRPSSAAWHLTCPILVVHLGPSLAAASHSGCCGCHWLVTGCAKKVTPFSYLSFLPFVRCIIFAIFVYLHIIFIKYLISEPSVVSIQMDSPAGWCTITHWEKHDKLPQNGECFIHRASDVASKQPRFKPRWLCCLGCSSAASLA